MDRGDIQRRIDRAEQIAADGEKIIQTYGNRVLDLEQAGRDASHARAMLRALLGTRALQEHGQAILRSHLAG